MDNLENNSEIMEAETVPEEAQAEVNNSKPVNKLVAVYVLVGILFLGEILGFAILGSRLKNLNQSLNTGLEQVRSELSDEMTALNKNVKINEGTLKTVSENLDSLKEDHDELERTITEKVNAVSVAQKCANAVFYIEMYDENGYMMGSGSGFFIDESGIAVTNFHVIDGCSYATAMLANGEVYDITGVYDYDIAKDIAMIQVDGEGFDTLTVGDSENILAGAEVYAIGSPSGLDNTISTGIISNVSRYVDGMDYIQFTAPISCGSSGGALLDENYCVIGITSAYWIGTGDNGTQNLNLAIPISLIDELDRESTQTLGEVYASTNVFSDAYVMASDSYFLLPTDGSRLITVFESTGDPDVTFRYEIEDESVLAAEWGDWLDDNTCEMTIHAMGEGSTCIWLYLVDADGEVICADYVWVDVTDELEDVELSSDMENLTVKVGETVEVSFHEGSAEGGYYLWYSLTNGNVECEWGEWDNDYNIPLYVTGSLQGYDLITVSLFDRYDTFISSIQVPVMGE
ncbi:MAG: trypsin-like peptidase domain-containing protein [Clostridia bacterium]|nr:trypsin-like peptidase domain-containing protein [Clostridia bacterium]